MSKGTRIGAMVLVVGLIAGCGSDSTSPSTTLSQAEKSALTQALTNTEFGALAAYVVQVVGKVGTLDASALNASINKALDHALSLSVTGTQGSSYEGAVGIAIEFNEMGTVGWFYGVVGWNGINTSASTVDEIVLVGGFGDTGTLPSSVSGTIENEEVIAFYETPSTQYYGTSGQASVSSSSFSGSTDCGASQQGFTIDCSYGTGTMSGNFNFLAQTLSGTGSYTQPKVTFSGLPAVKITISISQG